MNLYGLSCHASERVDAAVSHPAAFPVFCVAVWSSWWVIGENGTNFAISVLTAGLLFIMNNAQSRRSTKVEKKVDALARVNADIDDVAIEKEITP